MYGDPTECYLQMYWAMRDGKLVEARRYAEKIERTAGTRPCAAEVLGCRGAVVFGQRAPAHGGCAR